MTRINVSLPEDTFSTLRKSPDEVAHDMRVAVAVSWYARGMVSQGKAAEIAGMTRSEFVDALAQHGVSACQETADDIRELLAGG